MGGFLGQTIAALIGAGRLRRLRRRLLAQMVAGFLAALALIFFAVAGFYALEPSIGSAGAAALVAVILLLLAVLVMLGMILTKRHQPVEPALLAVILKQLGTEGGLPLWAIAGLAGVVLGLLRSLDGEED